MDRSRLNLLHQNVGHPLFTPLHLLQDAQQIGSIEVVAWRHGTKDGVCVPLLPLTFPSDPPSPTPQILIVTDAVEIKLNQRSSKIQRGLKGTHDRSRLSFYQLR